MSQQVNLKELRNEKRYYDISVGASMDKDGMAFLKSFFPRCICDRSNLIMFSTGGPGCSSTTIEQIEDDMEAIYHPDEDLDNPEARLSYLIIQPFSASMIYGNCLPKDKKDLDWLKALRQSSQDAMMKIGMSHP